MKVLTLLFIGSLFSLSCFASCSEHEQKLKKYTNHLKNFKSKSCYFPKTNERKPCVETEILEEIKARRLASVALLSACNTTKTL